MNKNKNISRINFINVNVILIFTLMIITFMAPVSAIFATTLPLTVTGKVRNTTCNYDGNKNTIINVPNTGVENLQTPGSAGEWAEFSFVFDDCVYGPNGARFFVAFSGTPADDDATKYKNSGNAKNVELELTYRGQNNNNSGPGTSYEIGWSGSFIVPLRARVTSVKGGATGGSVESVVVMAITYR